MRRALIVLALAVAAVVPASAVRTVTRTESPERLARGEADGVAVSLRGALFLAPELRRLGSGAPPGRPGHVWSMTRDAAGNLYLGTGPEGRIIKLTPAGTQADFFTVDEPLVTALAVTPDGDLLAGTAPGGRIYRVRPDGTGRAWSETGERYVWSLAVTADGQVFAGTGEQGAILLVNRSGNTEPFFDSNEPHIMSLLPHPGGGLLAGGAGRGIVYQIDAEGNGLVLLDGELPEVAALALEEDGGILAAFVAPPEPEADRPALELRLPDGVRVGTTDETVGSLERSTGPRLRGVIRGLEEGRGPDETHVRGQVVRILPSGEAIELWRSPREAPFCLLGDGGGDALFGTGEPARLYRVESGGDVAALGTLVEAQITGLIRVGRSVFLATSNPAAAYRVDPDEAERGVFVSPPLDAGGPARWGSIRWRTGGGTGRAEIYTRTGNSEEPDDTWSAWSPALTTSEASRIVNPDGRYLQWRARLVGSSGIAPRVDSVTVLFEPYNRPPGVRDFAAEKGETAFSGDAAFRWSASDPDGDPVELLLEVRPPGPGPWSRAASAISEPDPGSAEPWAAGRLVWDTRALAEGPYELRVTATDRMSNAPDEEKQVPVGLPFRIVVDRTPPLVEIESAPAGGFRVRVADDHSEIRALQLVSGGSVRHALRPEDGVSDSRSETYRVEAPQGDGPWTLRGVDAAGNVAERALTAP